MWDCFTWKEQSSQIFFQTSEKKKYFSCELAFQKNESEPNNHHSDIHKNHFIKDISPYYNTDAAIRTREQTEPSKSKANLGRQLKYSNLQASWVSGYISSFKELCYHLCTISLGVTKQAARPRNQGEETRTVCTLRVWLLSAEMNPLKGNQVIPAWRIDTVLIRSVQTEPRSCLRQGIMNRQEVKLRRKERRKKYYQKGNNSFTTVDCQGIYRKAGLGQQIFDK